MLALEGPLIIYAVSDKMVVYDQPTNQQSIFSHHTRDITCFCIRKEDGLIASAEGTKRPHVYIWDYRTMETKEIIRFDHTDEVTHMAFAEQQPLLAVATQRHNSPILLF